MPKRMPDLAGRFSDAVVLATDLATAGEIARVQLGAKAGISQSITLARLELLYEMAYLRVFLAWETFLEQSFLRYICGYSNSIGPEPLVQGGTFYPSIAAAYAALLGSRQYILWHNPQVVCNRVQGYINGGLHYQVIQSAISDLEYYAAIRHRIAHSQDHARAQFDIATTALQSVRYRGSRAGKFLRDWDSSGSTPVRWLEKIAVDLVNLAEQITPS